MATLEKLRAETLTEFGVWGVGPPPRLEEDDVDLLAFELWHLGSYPESDHEREWLTPEEEALTHCACL